MRFVTTAAELNAREHIAVVQQAQRSYAYFIKAIETCDMMHATERARLIKEFKESGTWKEKFDTWGAASELLLDMTARHSNRIIASVSDDSGHKCPVTSDKATADKSETLKKVAKLPPPPKNADEWEEKEHFTKLEPEEKPCVKAATPEQMKGNGAPKTENGRPKYALAVWRELEESHFGRALNRIDELNRQCPNPVLHAKLIAADKQCLAILDEWKQGVIHG